MKESKILSFDTFIKKLTTKNLNKDKTFSKVAPHTFLYFDNQQIITVLGYRNKYDLYYYDIVVTKDGNNMITPTVNTYSALESNTPVWNSIFQKILSMF